MSLINPDDFPVVRELCADCDDYAVARLVVGPAKWGFCAFHLKEARLENYRALLSRAMDRAADREDWDRTDLLLERMVAERHYTKAFLDAGKV